MHFFGPGNRWSSKVVVFHRAFFLSTICDAFLFAGGVLSVLGDKVPGGDDEGIFDFVVGSGGWAADES